MSQFHKVFGEGVKLSQDRTTGRSTGGRGPDYLFSANPVTHSEKFYVKVSAGRSGGFLPLCVGVTTVDPASRSRLPDYAEDLTGSWVVSPRGELSKDGVMIEKKSDLYLVERYPTVIGLAVTAQGSVTVTQDGRVLGDLCTEVAHPIWAVVEPMAGASVTVLRQDNHMCMAYAIDQYKCDSHPRGYAVIINISQVMGSNDRLGSENDVTRLNELFTKLHFQVSHYENLSATDLITTLANISKEDALPYHDCFVLFLMSHGKKGFICAADGEKINLKETFWMFSNKDCPGLRGKPKLIVIQACSGSSQDAGIEVDSAEDSAEDSDSLSHIIPAISDMLVAYASISGFVSYRNKISGSWFIQSIVDVFEERANDLDVTRMMQKVTGDVQQKAGKYTQCPIFTSTLNKEFYIRT